MDIDALKTFLEVNRTRHFGQAAQNLYVSQSTVSARIRLLEEQIGLPLFTRQRNNIQLTHAGQKLLRYADNIVTNWSRARQEIAINERHGVPLVVGAASSLWDSILQEWMQYMFDSVPELMLHAEVYAADTLLRRTLERSMDLSFVFDRPQSAELECIEVAQVPLRMVTSQANLRLHEAMQHNYILVEWGTSFATTHARYFPDAPPPRMRAMLGRLARDFILKQGGTAYLIEPMVSRLLEKKLLFLVKDAPVIDRTVYALYRHDSDKLATIQQACHYFKAKAKPITLPEQGLAALTG